jgi:hypothetical protein
VPIVNENVFDLWQERLRTDELSEFCSAMLLFSFYNRLEDVIGEEKAGNTSSANWMAFNAYNILLKALLCSVDETQPNLKWIYQIFVKNIHMIPINIRDMFLEVLRFQPDLQTNNIAITLARNSEVVIDYILKIFPRINAHVEYVKSTIIDKESVF